jgi:two-component system, cell cycle response regulator DivK
MSRSRILIIDDNEMNIQLASFVLSRADLVVESAADVNQGMAQIAAFRPDLVLMDIQMPDMDGLELTRRLKADASTKHIAVVAFTAYAMHGDEAKMLAAGCDGYISKPIDFRTFANQVRSFIRASA